MTRPETCIRCLRRERYQHLLVCEDCARDLVVQRAEPVRKPAWVERMEQNAKDFTERAA